MSFTLLQSPDTALTLNWYRSGLRTEEENFRLCLKAAEQSWLGQECVVEMARPPITGCWTPGLVVWKLFVIEQGSTQWLGSVSPDGVIKQRDNAEARQMINLLRKSFFTIFTTSRIYWVLSIYPRIFFITWTFFPPRRGENCVGFEMTNNFYLIRSDSRLWAPSLYRSSIPHFKISFGCITKSEIIAKLRTNDFDISTSCHEVSDVKARPSWIVFPTRWSLRRRGNAMTTSKDIVRSVSSILLS